MKAPTLLLLATLLATAGLAPSPAVAGPAVTDHGKHPASAPRAVPCSRGLVALTFDDGPSATVTPKLVRVLKRLDVPATFFMVGSRIASAPEAARAVDRAGFAIGNHTWAHTDLTSQSRSEMRAALSETRREMVRVGLHPTRLARPPYGAIDAVVSKVLARAGYTPVLWSVDSRDWAGGDAATIVRTILSEVRPHPTAPAGNIVLQHDGVTNSPATVRALPEEVRRLRARGYCFAGFDAHGLITPPVPGVTVTATRSVLEGERAAVTVRLDRPTSVPTSVVVRTADVTTDGGDYGWSSRRVRFAVGTTVARLRLPARRDGLDEAREVVRLSLEDGRGVSPSDAPARVTIRDGDGPPEVRVTGGAVTESSTDEVAAPVGVRLSYPSGLDVRVHLRTEPGSAGDDDVRAFNGWVVVPAGSRRAPVPIAVLPGPVDEEVESFDVRLVGARRAVVTGDLANVTIRPATSPPARPRLRVPRPAWS